MFIEVKIQPFTKLGYLATAQTSTCRSAGEKSCTFLAFRTSKFFYASCKGSKGSCCFPH